MAQSSEEDQAKPLRRCGQFDFAVLADENEELPLYYDTEYNTIQYPDNTEYSRLNRNLCISREVKCDQYKVAWFGSDL